MTSSVAYLSQAPADSVAAVIWADSTLSAKLHLCVRNRGYVKCQSETWENTATSTVDSVYVWV